MWAAMLGLGLLQAAIGGDTIRSYAENVSLDGARAHVTVAAVLFASRAGVMAIPIAWPVGDAVRLDLPPGVAAEVETGDVVSRVLVHCEGPGTTRARITFSAPRTEPLTYRLVNATGTPIEEYHLTVALPAGRLAWNASYGVPPSDRHPGVSPMRLDTAAGGRIVRLEAARIAPGEVVLLSVESGAERPSLVVLIGALLLAVLYLVRFRDLSRSRRGDSS